MLEICLQRNNIRTFLKNYAENNWNQIIPSLIELGILYLQNTFKKSLFTTEELHNIIQKNTAIYPPPQPQLIKIHNIKKKSYVQIGYRSQTPENILDNDTKKNKLKKISYAISYDKSLFPESIEKKVKNKNGISNRNNKKFYKKVKNKIIPMKNNEDNNFKKSGGFINTLFQKIDNRNNNCTNNLIENKEELNKFIQDNTINNIFDITKKYCFEGDDSWKNDYVIDSDMNRKNINPFLNSEYVDNNE